MDVFGSSVSHWSMFVTFTRLQLSGKVQVCKRVWRHRVFLSPPVWRGSWRPACEGGLRSPGGTPACPCGSGTPHSWLWTGCTCGTAPASARPRNASRAKGGRGWTPGSGQRSGHCAGTSCTGGRPPPPSPSPPGRNHLKEKREQIIPTREASVFC